MRDSYRDWLPSIPILLIVTGLSVPVAAVALHFLGFVKLVNGGFPVELSTFADIAGVFSSILLTLALVLLYREQTKIQERQEEWMEAEHVPDVFVEEWRLDSNRVTLWLSNLGTGVARNLHVELEIEATPDTDRLLAREQLAQIDPYNTVLQTHQDGSTKMEGVLRFETKPSSGTESDEFGTRSATEVLSDLRSQTVDGTEVSVTLTLHYEYIRRVESRKSVFSWDTELTDVESLEDLLQNRRRRTDSELDVAPEYRRDSAQ